MEELNGSNNQQLPPNATAISTEELLVCIGELFVQTRVLRKLLNNKLEEDRSATQRESQISSN